MRDWGRLVALYPGGDAMPKAKNPREDLMLRSPAPARWAFWRRRTARCGSDEPEAIKAGDAWLHEGETGRTRATRSPKAPNSTRGG